MDAIKQSSGSIIFLKSFLLAMILVMMSSFTSVQAADEKIGAGSNNNGFAYKQIGVQNPSTDLWRAIRQRVPEGSNNSSSANQAKSMGLDSSSSTSLINTQGQEWRNFRMNKFIPLSMLLLAGVFLVLLLFRLIRGKIKIKSGRSGKKILRFSGMQRFVHWTVAILFVILAITGTLLTFGRIGLVPLIGSSAFGSIAGFGKLLHDYLGPVFGIMLVIMLFTFIKGNFGNMTDIKWFLKGGGIFGKHASAGRYNAGEKLWFWIAILAGAVVVISGVILDFPFFDQTRGDIEL